MENEILAIRTLFSSGDFEEAKKRLAEFMKRYDQLSEEEQSFIIGMTINFEDYERARMLLSLDCDNPNKQSDSEFYLKKLLYYGQIKFREQSIESGLKLFDKVIKAIKENKEKISELTYKTLISSTVSNLRAMYDFKSIIELEKFYPYSDPLPVVDCLMKIEVLRAKTFLANKVTEEDLHELATLQSMHPESSSYTSVIKLHELEMKLFFNFLSEEDLKEYEAFILVNKIPPTHIKHFYHLIGLAKYKFGHYDEAVASLSRALTDCGLISYTQSIYYWIDKMRPGTLTTSESILLKCAPTRAMETYLCGNRFAPSPLLKAPFYQVELDKMPDYSSFDCWFINKQGIEMKSYNNLPAEGRCLDLKAGLFFGGKKTVVLTDLRTQLLRHIVSFGKRGAHQSYLIDTIFDGTFYYYESAKLRLKNLIVEINKLGIKIKRKNNAYFFDFEKNNFSIIFPINHGFSGPIAFLEKSSPALSRQIIEKHLNVKPSTASLYLKKWKDEGLIFKDPSQKYGEFSFSSKAPTARL